MNYNRIHSTFERDCSLAHCSSHEWERWRYGVCKNFHWYFESRRGWTCFCLAAVSGVLLSFVELGIGRRFANKCSRDVYVVRYRRLLHVPWIYHRLNCIIGLKRIIWITLLLINSAHHQQSSRYCRQLAKSTISVVIIWKQSEHKELV